MGELIKIRSIIEVLKNSEYPLNKRELRSKCNLPLHNFKSILLSTENLGLIKSCEFNNSKYYYHPTGEQLKDIFIKNKKEHHKNKYSKEYFREYQKEYRRTHDTNLIRMKCKYKHKTLEEIEKIIIKHQKIINLLTKLKEEENGRKTSSGENGETATNS